MFEKRDQFMGLRLTETEKRTIEAGATERGWKPAAFARWLIFRALDMESRLSAVVSVVQGNQLPTMFNNVAHGPTSYHPDLTGRKRQ